MRPNEKLMLQDIWRKAFREGGLDIPFKTKAGAVRARLQLYAAVSAQKKGFDMEDLELVHAAEKLEIVSPSPTVLRLQLKIHNDSMTSLAAVLGRTVEDYVDPEAQAAAERMLRELEGHKPEEEEDKPVQGHQDNPFYGKRA